GRAGVTFRRRHRPCPRRRPTIQGQCEQSSHRWDEGRTSVRVTRPLSVRKWKGGPAHHRRCGSSFSPLPLGERGNEERGVFSSPHPKPLSPKGRGERITGRIVAVQAGAEKNAASAEEPLLARARGVFGVRKSESWSGEMRYAPALAAP